MNAVGVFFGYDHEKRMFIVISYDRSKEEFVENLALVSLAEILSHVPDSHIRDELYYSEDAELGS